MTGTAPSVERQTTLLLTRAGTLLYADGLDWVGWGPDSRCEISLSSRVGIRAQSLGEAISRNDAR